MSKLTIGIRSLLTLGSLVLAMAIGGGVALIMLQRASQRTEEVVQHTETKIVMSGLLERKAADLLSAQRSMVILAYGKDTAGAPSAAQQVATLQTELRQELDRLRATMAEEEARRPIETMSGILGQLTGIIQQVQDQLNSGNTDEAFHLTRDRCVPLHDQYRAAAEKFSAVIRGQMEAKRQAALDDASFGFWLLLALMLVALAPCVLGIIGMWRSTRAMQRIAYQISSGADQVAGAAGQVASASQSLAQGAAEQAASLEETSASGEELTSMTRKNAENAQSAAGLADESQLKVQQANNTLGQMVASMNEITASSSRISKIIKVIDEIAFQTNILALNAAVEAARAGEAGMGFAVVADEVRSLAQRCAQAAKDTASLIEESIQKSTAGSDHLNQVVNAVSSITQSAVEIKTLAQEVNLGSQEQSRGIDQIAKAITQMESVTQKTAANAEQGAAASQELSAQANALKSFSRQLQEIVGTEDHAALPLPGAAPRAPARPALPTPEKSTAKRLTTELKSPPVTRTPEQEFPLEHEFQEF